MGHELNKLLNRYGVSSPTIAYSGGLTEEQKPAFDAYKAEYQRRIAETPSYVGQTGHARPPASQQAPGGVLSNFANGNPMSAMGSVTPGAQSIFNPLQASQAATPARTPEGQQTIKDWFAQNPGVTDAQVKAKQAEYGVSNPDIFAATGNYWGNTLKVPSFAKAPGDLGPPKPPGVASNGSNGAPGYVPAGPAAPTLLGESEPLADDLWLRKTREARGYADGGMVEDDEPQYGRGLDLSRVTPEQLALLQKQDSGALQRGVARFAGATQVPAVNPMLELLAKYQNPTSDYAGELKAARDAHTKESQAFQDMIKQAAEAQNDTGPSKSEMYFRLAAALGSPTKTGSFGETLGNAANTIGQYQGEVRNAQRAGAAAKLQLALQGQQARMAASKDDLATTRQLADEEIKGKRAEGTKMLEAYLKSGQPQSEAGKIAIDAGLAQGTPEYNSFVKKYVADKIESGNVFKQMTAAVAQGNLENAQARTDLQVKAEERKAADAKKLSPTELKLKVETEDLLNATNEGLFALKQAYELNPKTFDGTIADKVRRFALENTNPKDEQVVSTRTQENLLSEKAVAGLKSAFGGNPTEGERKILLDLQGISAKSKEERKGIMLNAYAVLKRKQAQQATRLSDIKSGNVRLASPAPETLPDSLGE